ncbi:MAG: c-type cytochrome domain-containing protein [Gallionella sp.]
MNQKLLQGFTVLSALLFSSWVVAAPTAPTPPPVSYKTDVTPIIHDYCLSCHEPSGKGFEKSGLDMRTYASLMKGTKFGAIVKPGDSFTSILIQVVEGRVHASIKMPFGMEGGLSKDKISVLKKWVDQGAKDN